MSVRSEIKAHFMVHGKVGQYSNVNTLENHSVTKLPLSHGRAFQRLITDGLASDLSVKRTAYRQRLRFSVFFLTTNSPGHFRVNPHRAIASQPYNSVFVLTFVAQVNTKTSLVSRHAIVSFIMTSQRLSIQIYLSPRNKTEEQ